MYVEFVPFEFYQTTKSQIHTAISAVNASVKFPTMSLETSSDIECIIHRTYSMRNLICLTHGQQDSLLEETLSFLSPILFYLLLTA